MSIFTEFSNQYGQGAHTGVDLTGNSTGMHQTIVSGYVPGSEHTGVPGQTVVSHLPDGVGGENTYYNGQFVHDNQPNIFGEENVYDSSGHLLRTSIPDNGGADLHGIGQHYVHNGIHGMMGNESGIIGADHSNANQILSYDDPLLHSGKYVMPPYDPTQSTK
jgi:hypothetical protein